MTLPDFDNYTRITGEDGSVYIVIFELPARKLLCVKELDVQGGADTVNVVLWRNLSKWNLKLFPPMTVESTTKR